MFSSIEYLPQIPESFLRHQIDVKKLDKVTNTNSCNVSASYLSPLVMIAQKQIQYTRNQYPL